MTTAVATAAGVAYYAVDAQGRRLYSSAAACDVAGATYRQAVRWVDLGVIVPTVPPHGSGTCMKWSHDDLVVLRLLTLVAGVDGRRSMSAISGDLLRIIVESVERPVPATGHLVVRPDGVTLHFDDLAALRADVAVIVVPLAAVHDHVNSRTGRMDAASSASPQEAPTPPADSGGALDGASGTGPKPTGGSSPLGTGGDPRVMRDRDEAPGPNPGVLAETSA